MIKLGTTHRRVLGLTSILLDLPGLLLNHTMRKVLAGLPLHLCLSLLTVGEVLTLVCGFAESVLAWSACHAQDHTRV